MQCGAYALAAATMGQASLALLQDSASRPWDARSPHGHDPATSGNSARIAALLPGACIRDLTTSTDGTQPASRPPPPPPSCHPGVNPLKRSRRDANEARAGLLPPDSASSAVPVFSACDASRAH